jgi:hypothetical protein
VTNRFSEAIEAYEEALRLEPSLSSVADSLQDARAAAAARGQAVPARSSSSSSSSAPASTGGAAMPPGMPDLSSLAGLAGLGGGGGGMPDLSALGGLMNNPMVQNMMQNPQFMSMYVRRAVDCSGAIAFEPSHP